MKMILGICMYLLDIPVILWLYYRCLEKEPLVFRRGRYPLLFLHVFLGACCLMSRLGNTFFTTLAAFAAVLVLETFFLINILWAKRGMDAFVKTTVFLSIFRLLTLGTPAWISHYTLAPLETIPVGKDYVPAAAGAGLSVAAGFFLLAWILNRRFFEKVPCLVQRLAAGLISMGVLGYELYILSLAEEPIFLLTAAFLLAAGGGIVLLLCQKRAIRGEAYSIRQQRRIFEDYSVALDRQNTIVRQMSHDIGGYLTEMKRLAKEDKGEAMDEATWKIQSEYGKLAFVEYSNNRLVNAVLHRKLEVCRAKKIRTQIDLAQFDGGFVENTDWLEIFFCLFDNAVEACSRLERGRERFIRVKAKCAGGFEVIVFLNSKEPGQKSGNGRHTTKGSSYEYGVGLHSLEEILGKYGGTVICKEEEDTFQTTVSIQVREKKSWNE